ncbi:helix-turn-helix domain-containing protein [Amycolatopsis anabasis]|uniref:helix-turn-helix domain-containing protein n=1 Tax=Amycolatopsis anabasis TaxID=1840409 RepID=UPI00131C96C1|nr:helix-turn-helix domain-containing protein [Amycolatopsis anabasis]
MYEPILSSSFGGALRECRIDAGLTQEELADQSGLSVRAISDLERGRTRRPQRKTIELLAKALDLGERETAALTRLARVAIIHPDAEIPRTDPSLIRHHRAFHEPTEERSWCDLPPDMPGLIGREHELGLLDRLLHTDRHQTDAQVRIALITGHPGVGKTALAVHAAHRWRHDFPDGQLHMDLAPQGQPVLRPAEIVRRVAASLGAAPADGAEDLEHACAQLRALLAWRRVLIVLDNATSEAQIRSVFPGVGGTSVLATCQHSLSALVDVPIIALEPLAMGESLAVLSAMVGERRLAAERDAALRLARLCGGLPIALRAVGAHLRVRPHWSLHRLLASLIQPGNRLKQLAFDDLGVDSCLARAYDALDPESQKTLRALAHVENGTYTSGTAAAVLDRSIEEAEFSIERLIDSNLLQVGGRDASGHLHFTMHPLLRLSALKRAAEVDDPVERKALAERARESAESSGHAGSSSTIFPAGPDVPGMDAPASARLGEWCTDPAFVPGIVSLSERRPAGGLFLVRCAPHPSHIGNREHEGGDGQDRTGRAPQGTPEPEAVRGGTGGGRPQRSQPEGIQGLVGLNPGELLVRYLLLQRGHPVDAEDLHPEAAEQGRHADQRQRQVDRECRQRQREQQAGGDGRGQQSLRPQPHHQQTTEHHPDRVAGEDEASIARPAKLAVRGQRAEHPERRRRRAR